MSQQNNQIYIYIEWMNALKTDMKYTVLSFLASTRGRFSPYQSRINSFSAKNTTKPKADAFFFSLCASLLSLFRGNHWPSRTSEPTRHPQPTHLYLSSWMAFWPDIHCWPSVEPISSPSSSSCPLTSNGFNCLKGFDWRTNPSCISYIHQIRNTLPHNQNIYLYYSHTTELNFCRWRQFATPVLINLDKIWYILTLSTKPTEKK